MWLFNSSIGRKLVMSITGFALVLFITFHGCMNVVALISGEAYNTICALLQNRKARGSNKYAVTDKPEKVEWASQNMLVLGIIICLGLLLHLFNFWYNMMFAEIIGAEGLKYGPADGFNWIKETFSNPVFSILYIIWLIAIWFHLTHGMWSSMQTLGLSGHVWFKRWKCIGQVWSTVIMALFLIVVLGFWLFPDAVGKCDFKLLPFAVG